MDYTQNNQFGTMHKVICERGWTYALSRGQHGNGGVIISEKDRFIRVFFKRPSQQSLNILFQFYFYRDQQAYKGGFGNLEKEFWIGLNKIKPYVELYFYIVCRHLTNITTSLFTNSVFPVCSPTNVKDYEMSLKMFDRSGNYYQVTRLPNVYLVSSICLLYTSDAADE